MMSVETQICTCWNRLFCQGEKSVQLLTDYTLETPDAGAEGARTFRNSQAKGQS